MQSPFGYFQANYFGIIRVHSWKTSSMYYAYNMRKEKKTCTHQSLVRHSKTCRTGLSLNSFPLVYVRRTQMLRLYERMGNWIEIHPNTNTCQRCCRAPRHLGRMSAYGIRYNRNMTQENTQPKCLFKILQRMNVVANHS